MPRVNLNKQLMMPSYLTQWIKHRKVDLRLTDQDIASALGCTRQNLERKYKTHKYTTAELIAIFKICEATGEDVERLLLVERKT